MATQRRRLLGLALALSPLVVPASWTPARALAFPPAPAPLPTAAPNPLSRTPVPLPAPTATPTPLARGTAVPLPVQTPRQPIVPSALRVTTSVAECQQHGGNFACGALAGGALTITVLVWNGEAAADSYTVYRSLGTVDRLHGALKAGTNTGKLNGVVPTAFSLDNVVAGACYAVSETIGSNESTLSAPVCPGASAKTATLNPVHLDTYSAGGETKCTATDFGGSFTGTSPSGGNPSVLQVGYQNVASTCHGYGGLTSGQQVTGTFARGAAFFDVTRFGGHAILKAVLTLPVASGSVSSQSCATTVSNGATYWWNDLSTEPAAGAPSFDATALAGVVDVTSLVSAWVLGPDHGGAPNFGFVLQGAHEDFTPGTCLTTYGSPTLVVTYR